MSQTNNTSSFLLVPIDLDAMCIGKEDSEQRTSLTAPATANFVTLPYMGGPQGPNLSDLFVNKPFQTESLPLKIGVHLHWALPDALTQGMQIKNTDTGAVSIQFPNVPNRWLVTRILTSLDGDGSQTTQKSWIVESDFLSTDANTYYDHTNIPFNKGGNFAFSQTNPPFRYMGRAIELEKWSESPDPNIERLTPLTAIGYGEPRFASYYPNCKTVFGFQDTFADQVNFNPDNYSISYAVIGWYNDQNNDPIHSSNDLAKTLDTFHWELPDKTQIDSISQMACVGMLGNVKWNPTTNYISSKTDLSATQVALANTNSEGLASLLSALIQIPGLSRSQLERFIEALQIGYLDKLTDVGAMADLQRVLHKSFFGTKQTETLWTIIPADPKTEDATGLSEQVSKDLNQLNRYQIQADQNSAQILSIKKQVFADWYKFIASLYPATGNPPPVSSNDIRQFIEANTGDQSQFQVLSDNLSTLTSEIQTLSQKISDEIGKGYSLKAIEAPRFYKPNDPIVLISGKDLQPSSRYGFDGAFSESGKLLCRLDTQTITAFQFTSSGKSYAIVSGQLPKYSDISNIPLGNLPDLVLSELYYLDKSQWGVLLKASEASSIPGILEQLRSEFDSSGSETFYKNHIASGVIPSPLQFNIWDRPWHPILLQWNFAFRPYQTIETVTQGIALPNYIPDFIQKNCKLPDGETDLKYGGEGLGQEQNYTGATILTPQAIKNLKDRVNDYQKYSSNPIVQKILEQAVNIPVLSQALSGFNEALGMQAQEMQFQVHDPLARGLERTFNQKIQSFVNGTNDANPLTEINFNPIRCGLARIQKLRVIDAFGQYRDYDTPPTVASRSLSVQNDIYPAFLPPRFVQPARLLFRWLSTYDDAEEMNSINSPIHGWILPNYLDGSLILYDQDGNSLGSIAAYDDSGIFFESSPGSNPLITIRVQDADFSQKMNQTFKNSHILEFVSNILNRKETFLKSFISTLDKSLQFIEPQNYSETTSLVQFIGRPIAIVRAKLKVELKGNPVQNQSWASLHYNISNQNRSDVAGFTQVSFPLRLGSALQYQDGLLGFYPEKDGKTDFSVFYSSHSDGSDSTITIPSETTITLKPDPAEDPTTVLLLVDPRASIHATTGIVPQKRIDIPRYHYAQALEKMSVTFQTAPVLTPSDRLQVPIPLIAGTDWTWVEKESGSWQNLSSIEKVHTETNFSSNLLFREGWLKIKATDPKQNSNGE
ncbi:hypothetical protein LEP1GSC050_4213 [Leptospira broomii serovar Hurstbridge str. 5399]|uniref:Uncharacterized protein n=1 Tax=Leptospira broomii serovar Hurstbridge str. 5399 TaxID=1049789 RepID=T0F0F3_9LEPT|nr:hypothetical protein [Leptospira broomii]EQA44610.1 hypothetical protein LEP1GSC050_4213 [Leptospira broomii serovar Hurstbridge str. 5399]